MIMEDEKDEQFGTIIFDGKIINLDKASPEELEELKEKLKIREAELREKIDKILDEED